MKKSSISLRNVLVLVKAPRIEYFDRETLLSFRGNPSVQKILNDFEVSSAAHKKNVKLFINLFKKYRATNSGVTYTKDYGRISEPILNQYDLIISLGGDGTYLKTVSYFKQPGVPVLGINTDITGSEGYLCSDHIDYNDENGYKKFKKLFDRLLAGDYEMYERRRISMEVYDNARRMTRWEKYALNDVFFSNPEPGQLTSYRMRMDDGPFENFKSSGLLTATMTGSTAWLRNAKKISRQAITQILDVYHNNYLDGSSFKERPDKQQIIDSLQEELRLDRNIDHTFRKNAIHYLVREKRSLKNGLSGNPDPYPTMGYVNQIELINTSMRANISIDGMIGCNSDFGDTIRLSLAPERCSIYQICLDGNCVDKKPSVS
eukprot:CAMPEP_0115014484 /NCGR_PEP_ID=MMETSP0216-20121206/26110_1 /TAXON_ID=223996 /ORGANISM="Protocruzia adherens, Strain Boccale" /LENGTH=374 /DNA_ID=CAMNT_0002384241 /DNA_START=232 /DNA_END=1356 /DNA_ORIENTATION=-